MEKRPIPELLSELQPEHAKAALIEYNNPENVEWRKKYAISKVENHREAVENGFDWSISEQGADHWLEISKALELGTYIFPTKEESQDEKENIIYNFEKMIYLSERLLDFELGDGDDNYKKMIDEAKESVEELKSKYKITRIQ